MASMAAHVRATPPLKEAGTVTFDYGNNIRAQAQSAGVPNAFDFPGSCPPSSGRSSARAMGPFRWAALSGDPADILATDRAILKRFPRTRRCGDGSRWPRRGCRPGLPARTCWLGHGERARGRAGIQRAGPLRQGRAPIVIAATTGLRAPSRRQPLDGVHVRRL